MKGGLYGDRRGVRNRECGNVHGIGSAAMCAMARKELGSRSSGYTGSGLGPRAMCRSGIGCFAHHGPQAHIGSVKRGSDSVCS